MILLSITEIVLGKIRLFNYVWIFTYRKIIHLLDTFTFILVASCFLVEIQLLREELAITQSCREVIYFQ